LLNHMRERKDNPQREYSDIHWILDIGSGSVKLTDQNGNQKLNADYCNLKSGEKKIKLSCDGWEKTPKQYMKEVEKIMKQNGLGMHNVAARFTGSFRNQQSTYGQRRKVFEKALKAAGVRNSFFLPNEVEGRYGSEHTLSIIWPYYKSLRETCPRLFIIAELGQGTYQGACYLHTGNDGYKNEYRHTEDNAEIPREFLEQCNANVMQKQSPASVANMAGNYNDVAGGRLSLMNSLMFSDAGSNADRVGGHQIITSPEPRDEPQVGTKWMAKLRDGDTLRNYTVEVKNKNDDGTYFVTFPNFPNHKGGMTVKQAQLLGKITDRRRLTGIEELLELCRANGYDQ